MAMSSFVAWIRDSFSRMSASHSSVGIKRVEWPDYRKRDLPDSNDFRRTLYWNPDVLTDENGRASVVFYSNARPGVKLGITARAVLPDGSILDFSR